MSHEMSSERYRCTTTNIRKIAEIANRKTLFLVKRKTGVKAAPSEPVSSHLLMPVETGFTTHKTV